HKAKFSPASGQRNQENLDEAKEKLKSILEQVSDEKRNERGISKQNLIWSISTDKLRAALFRWIEAEQHYELTVSPRFFEVSFGGFTGDSDPELSASEPIPIKDVNMKGKIDRIDIGEDFFNVVDYKTGSSTIGIQDMREGRSLQLPVYLKVVESLFTQHANLRGLSPAAGLYQKIRLRDFKQELGIGKEQLNGNAYQGYNGSRWYDFGSSNKQCLEDEDFNSFLDRICGYVELYVERITEGFFPLITRAETDVDLEKSDHAPDTPKDPTKPCNYCNYKRQCRVRAFEEDYQID
ncbi:PD-(D/E)XK nuclease family protein, partial [Candidatus Poribacteria bacterium]|nr:PD-(D/E)XK nuclease family protein [Candidatus Poribacteria bacterium]